MKTVFVTGATGFIGQHLTERLVKLGHRVKCLHRPQSNLTRLRDLSVELISGSLDQTQILRKGIEDADWVFHLAAVTAPPIARLLKAANAQGSVNVSSACGAVQRPPILVHVSSVSAAGPTPRGTIKVESEAATPVSNYGKSKRLGEIAAERFAHQVPTTIVRPGVVFGPENTELLPAFRAIRQTRFHVVPGIAPPPLSLVHVEDLVELLIRAAERGTRLQPWSSQVGQGYYFACDAEHPNYARFGKMIGAALGLRQVGIVPLVPPLHLAVGGAAQLWDALRGKAGHLNLDKMRDAMAPSWACSPAAAEMELGIRMSTLARRLSETVEWYRAHGWL